ncbi:hypothetical protein [Bailinhaonella thermotolerans]|uniref:Uncharacterized protein n=1 Tax=Bailinhaonella thermotolerans TaxID=1070861 RepID=A0A3A4B6S4_9ACTN|nr:hypothetical protein [Bailinhaonella thermotolerans]RJL33214.1 hypothetical protein D5H75_10265 [Bailinhaonella thermotolerans]
MTLSTLPPGRRSVPGRSWETCARPSRCAGGEAAHAAYRLATSLQVADPEFAISLLRLAATRGCPSAMAHLAATLSGRVSETLAADPHPPQYRYQAVAMITEAIGWMTGSLLGDPRAWNLTHTLLQQHQRLAAHPTRLRPLRTPPL